jgi:hypothetical protein
MVASDGPESGQCGWEVPVRLGRTGTSVMALTRTGPPVPTVP